MNEVIENRKFFIRKKTYDGKFYDYGIKEMSELHKYIRRKTKDIGFWVNQLKDGEENTHAMKCFDIPFFTWIDIDFHDAESKQEFISDVKKKYKNVDAFMDAVKKDKHTFILGKSIGGGIRIITIFTYLYNLDAEMSDETEKEYKNYFTDKQSEIYEVITKMYIHYISRKFGLRPNAKYMDECSTRLSQPTFGLRDDKYFYFNNYCESHEFIFDLNTMNELEARSQAKASSVLSNEEILDKGLKNSELIRDIYNNDHSLVQGIFKTHNPRLIAIVKWSDEETRKIWYELYSQYYTGASFKPYLRDFNSFDKYLDSCKNLTQPTSLYWFLKNG